MTTRTTGTYRAGQANFQSLDDQERFAETRQHENGAGTNTTIQKSAPSNFAVVKFKPGFRFCLASHVQAPVCQGQVPQLRLQLAHRQTTGPCEHCPHKAIISPTATSGPINAPTVSIDCRRPNAAPRVQIGVISATSASLGAPLMPLPMRSAMRAMNTVRATSAKGNSGFTKAARP